MVIVTLDVTYSVAGSRALEIARVSTEISSLGEDARAEPAELSSAGIDMVVDHGEPDRGKLRTMLDRNA